MAEVAKTWYYLACKRCPFAVSSVSTQRLLEYFCDHDTHVHGGLTGKRPAHKRREVVSEPQAWARFKIGDAYRVIAPTTFRVRKDLLVPTLAELQAELAQEFYEGVIVGIAEHVMMVELDIPEEVTV